MELTSRAFCPLYVTVPFKYVMTAGLAPLLAQQQELGSSHLCILRTWPSPGIAHKSAKMHSWWGQNGSQNPGAGEPRSSLRSLNHQLAAATGGSREGATCRWKWAKQPPPAVQKSGKHPECGCQRQSAASPTLSATAVASCAPRSRADTRPGA